MLTSKQRAALRGCANELESILQIGKGGLTKTVTEQANSALNARELIKCNVLENSPVTAREAADALAQVVGAEVVQVIGSRVVLFRQNKKDSKFDLAHL